MTGYLSPPGSPAGPRGLEVGRYRLQRPDEIPGAGRLARTPATVCLARYILGRPDGRPPYRLKTSQEKPSEIELTARCDHGGNREFHVPAADRWNHA